LVTSVGETFGGTIVYTQAEIAEFARLSGDENPLHHDTATAAESRFGGIIACGPQTTSRMMGMVATHFSRGSRMVGIEFSFRFRAPVYPDRAIEIVWRVTEVVDKPRLGGQVIALEGIASDAAGAPLLDSRGAILVTPQQRT